MSEERFREAFRRLTGDTPPAPSFKDLETQEAAPSRSIRLKPWMAAAGAAALVLVVVGVFGMIGGGGPDLAQPDVGEISYVRISFSSSIEPACEDVSDNGGFEEATIEVWGPNQDDLTLMVATFPDGTTERTILEGESTSPEYIWVEGDPESYPASSKFRIVRCEGAFDPPIVLDAASALGTGFPSQFLGPPPGFDNWGEVIERDEGDPSPAEVNGTAALLYEIRHQPREGTSAIDIYVTEDGERVLKQHSAQSHPDFGSAVFDYEVVESDRVPADTVSFDKTGLTAIAQTVGEFGREACPVTIPSQGFTPPEGYPATPPDPDSVWFGKDELWTLLPTDGDYGIRKSVWWSINFPGGHQESEPPLQVTYRLLNVGRDVVIENDRATNAYTEADGWFMIGTIDPDASGCWEVTAVYKGASLSYVYWTDEGRLDPETLGLVPDVVGMTVERAGNVLFDAGYDSSPFDSNDPTYEVCAQEPGAGDEINPGAIIGLRTAPPGECGALMGGTLEPNPSFATYVDEQGRHWYATSCPSADVLIGGGAVAADALPPIGQTWLTRINQQIDEFGDEFLSRNGLARIEPVVRNGEVWEEGDDGEIEVIQVNDYMIMATFVDRPCPDAPSFWNGIPVAFVDETGPPGTLCPESEPALSPAQVMVFFNCGDGAEPNPVGFARPLDPDSDPITAAFESLLAGPTPTERGRGAASLFGAPSSDALISAELSGSSLVVDFDESITVNNASTATGSQFFLSELISTALWSDEVGSVEFRINGSCEAFWYFLQGDGCQVIDRP